jgi:serine/threonine-protein kinase
MYTGNIVRQALAGRYALGPEIGHGCMSVVFRAEPVGGGASCAIKVLRPEIARLLGPERFEREIRILASLHHPHIVPLVEYGMAGSLPYLVMPFVAGETLRQRLDRAGTFTVDETLAVVRDIAEALDYAHARGVIHRDIKPENILHGRAGATLVDFGLARAVEVAGGESFSSSGIAIGTPAYMSPEQAMTGRTVDGRTDLYALGCLTFEMLAGDPPFSGATAQAVMARHLAEPPRRLTIVRPDAPRHIEEAIERVLAKSPDARPRTGAAFVALLSAAAPD